MPVSRMTLSKMPVSKMPVSKMPVSKMPVSKMPVNHDSNGTRIFEFWIPRIPPSSASTSRSCTEDHCCGQKTSFWKFIWRKINLPFVRKSIRVLKEVLSLQFIFQKWFHVSIHSGKQQKRRIASKKLI